LHDKNDQKRNLIVKEDITYLHFIISRINIIACCIYVISVHPQMR